MRSRRSNESTSNAVVLRKAVESHGTARVKETWLFDGRSWLLRSTDGPGARNHSAIAFDRDRGRLVLHGGHDGTVVFGDTWEWDGRTWIERLSAPPQRRVENNH